jgi:hypothetical protein
MNLASSPAMLVPFLPPRSPGMHGAGAMPQPESAARKAFEQA